MLIIQIKQMLTNVQQDVHNNNIIQLGTFRNAFHKATL
jgi:hypothetical protein